MRAFRRTKNSHRRGVVLLVVLGLMALFALVGVTFVITSSQYKLGSQMQAKGEMHYDPYDALLNLAFEQLLYGSTNRFSAIGPHSLLEDQYGTRAAVGYLTDLAEAGNGSMLLLTVSNTDPNSGAGSPAPLEMIAGQSNHRYVGQVITMLNGQLQGRSGRVTGYVVSGGTAVLRVFPFEGMIYAGGNWNSGMQLARGDSFVINGRDFSGPGFGYERTRFASTGQLDYGGAGNQIALLPNARHPAYWQYLGYGADGIVGTADDGGGPGVYANEAYDSPGYQDMALAYEEMTGSGPIVPIPSFVRPQLVRYWQSQGGWGNSNIKRRAMLRPIGEDHPVWYNSVNPNFDQNFIPGATPVWDVDNNYDGVTDSVWVDLGLPVRSDPQGRKYKPLFAFLVLDQDGKLNVNAHGTLNHDDGGNLIQREFRLVGGNEQFAPIGTQLAMFSGAGRSQAHVAAGLSASAGEVSLTVRDPSNNNNFPLMTQAEFRNLLFGVTSGTIRVEGRHGEGGLTTQPKAGITQVDDNFPPAAAYGVNGAPPVGFSGNGGDSLKYGSPADFHGFVSVGVDYRGQPLFWDMLLTQPTDEPFEIDLIRPHRHLSVGGANAIDNPFDVEELEWLLRPFDVDMAARSSRLATLCPQFVRTPYKRGIATTHSFHVPMIHFAPTREIRNFAQSNPGTRDLVNMSFVDLLAWKVRVAEGVGEAQAYQRAQNLITMQNHPIFPGLNPAVSGFGIELIAGVPIDLNRPFGNGRDDNGNGLVDEHYPGLSEGNEELWNNAAPLNVSVNLVSARYQMAMNLYLLGMTLTPERWVPTNNEGINAGTAEGRELRARTIAQWAVNVVDFRDKDAIMTPFEYDVNPFNNNGLWECDGLPVGGPDSGDRRLVWGCEHPDLVLTESLAFHDKRIADTDDETPVDPMEDPARTDDSDPMKRDQDYDQVRVPQGSLFVELYCVRNPNNPIFPVELSDGANPGINLSRLAPGDYPVWRMAITETGRTNGDNDVRARTQNKPDTISYQPSRMSLLQEVSPEPNLDIDRIVWFTGRSPFGPDQDKIFNARQQDGQPFGGNGPNYVLAPGHYAVIGPRHNTWTGPSANDQLFEIDNGLFRRRDASNNDQPYSPLGDNIKRPMGIICGAGQVQPNTDIYAGLSVSEPKHTAYYDLTGVDPTYPSVNPANKDYFAIAGTPKPKDAPYDKTKILGTDNVLGDGTHMNYRTVLLQRLANPMIPWNPEQGEPGHQANQPLNPYITVDWLPIDLSVFTTESEAPASADPDSPGNANYVFRSRERGRRAAPMAPPQNPDSVDIWTQISLNPAPATVDDPANTGNFKHKAGHTLGYLNATYGPGWRQGDTGFPGMVHLDDPKPPFPWLTWNDRPFMNRMELMMVPWSAPSRLYREFRHRSPAQNHYDDELQAPFRHLPNFFFSDPLRNAPDLHAILDYVDVPSRFTGTQKLLDPRYFNISQVPVGGMLQPYVAPYNFFPEYREPGKINFNTIRDQGHTWMGIMSGLDIDNGRGHSTYWTSVKVSRQGASPGNPADFSRPFVSPGNAYYDVVNSNVEPVDHTLLRRRIGSQDPLLSMESSFYSSTYNPPTKDVYNDTDRNAYFRYQPLQRAASVATGRSSVYAVWITVGLFEVRERMPNDGFSPPYSMAAYPDGYELGAELGSETGDIRRHRLFAIVDRSIPVAFQRGVRHNAWNCVKLHRIIE